LGEPPDALLRLGDLAVIEQRQVRVRGHGTKAARLRRHDVEQVVADLLEGIEACPQREHAQRQILELERWLEFHRVVCVGRQLMDEFLGRHRCPVSIG